MGCENLPHRGARFGIFKKVRIFATELARRLSTKDSLDEKKRRLLPTRRQQANVAQR